MPLEPFAELGTFDLDFTREGPYLETHPYYFRINGPTHICLQR